MVMLGGETVTEGSGPGTGPAGPPASPPHAASTAATTVVHARSVMSHIVDGPWRRQGGALVYGHAYDDPRCTGHGDCLRRPHAHHRGDLGGPARLSGQPAGRGDR